MNKYGEIRTDYEDEDSGIIYVDAWTTPDDNEEGTVIAKICRDTKEVEYLDDAAKQDSYAQEEINKILKTL